MELILGVIFFILILLIGGDRGATSLIALIANLFILIAGIFFMYLGFPALGTAFVQCILISIVTIFYPLGINKQTTASFVSVLLVFLLLFVVSFPVETALVTKGFSTEMQLEDTVSGLSSDLSLTMFQITLAVVCMGLMGALMDTSVTVASSISEIAEKNPELGSGELFHSGMRIGYDISGTMINTLFFAYLGESMMLTIRFYLEGYSFTTILNSKSFSQEFFRMLFGGACCILIIPVTAYVTSQIMTRKQSTTAKDILKN